ncbi:MAG: glucose-1-phosphate thymidylyltransferase [Flavobacteriales bacterium]|nr:glucose-1-phosphate thymidylyltransferase [Flavobacteriales bacterium]|tara:strand:+ start:15734 stop:16891 length:1158 start_codon:yes stop_codon:yes gene_type:complete
MNIILFDTNRSNYYPLSFSRPISFFRVGILTIKEKWEQYFSSVSVKTDEYLSYKFPIILKDDNIWINAKTIPSTDLYTEINNLRVGESLEKDGELIAFRNSNFEKSKLNKIDSNVKIKTIENLTDIFKFNSEEINLDFKFLTEGKKSNDIDDSNRLLGNKIYIEKGAKISCAILNAQDGPIYIGKDTEVMEGSIIKGPFAMLNNSQVKLGSRIYGGTTVGPFSKVAGEINNSILFGFSSKAHEGYLGNSIIGEWCNLGAGTNVSNLKNNYEKVKIWNYQTNKFKSTELQFCGLIMGDHSKSSINTMFNTGTVVGVGANIYGSGFPRNFIPSFSWGGALGFSIYKLNSFFSTAEKVFKRRDKTFDDIEKQILFNIYNMTKVYRNEL